MKNWYIFLIVFITLLSCQRSQDIIPDTLFSLLDPMESGVDFTNQLSFDNGFNIYTYRNYYNGGGVGIGDINNDGLMDIYFTANMQSNRLYINQGDLTFKEVSAQAGVQGKGAWSTGVSIVDINGDGYVDIYVCNSGDIEGDRKQNELFINQGNGTFVESAQAYGLADEGYSTHAAFFDYDKDGDLDMYLLNNSFQAIGSFNLKKNQRPIRSQDGGDKLYQNNDGLFEDVSEQAGIYGSIIGFGLGVTVGDIDLDGWQDIFVSNDFFERDYIYMNNRDGTFREDLENQMKSISGASMGADMADINNDGYPEIFVTEMLPEPNDRLKTKTTFENWDRYQYNLENGYHHQFTRNMMHLNNGNGSFSEVGRLLGVEATDWSWGALIADFDNDASKDLFVANGIHKDLTDQDYINYISTQEMAESVISKEGVDFQKLTDVIPSTKVSNYMFKNRGDLNFDNVTDQWGLGAPSHSNGSAYVDIDNDGDLDLVVNNLNESASIYLNHSELKYPNNGYLKLELKGSEENTQGVGARVVAHIDSSIIVIEQMPIRGFQSSVDPRPSIGMGVHDKIDSLIVYWSDGSRSKLIEINKNQILTISQENASGNSINPDIEKTSDPFFKDVSLRSGLDFVHKENDFVDFDRDRLIYHMLSTEGPAFCQGDFNNDGYEDIYVGGAKDQSGALYIGGANGKYQKVHVPVFDQDKVSEDVDCTCFDADGDNDLDLYVASGGNEFPSSSSALIDRLYINNGQGKFVKSDQILPSFQFENTACVSASDLDQDGDIDLFVGVRAKPFLIGVPVDGYILINDGLGNFENQTSTVASDLKGIGMITDAIWKDIDNDMDEDLLIVGEWMSVNVFVNENGNLQNQSKEMGLDSSNGWWNTIEAADLDNDGDTDFVLGNHGWNSRFRASQREPLIQYVNDFDQNGTAELILCTNVKGVSYPMVLKHDLVMQLPSLKKKYVAYESYKDQRVEDIFTEEQLKRAKKEIAYNLSSSIMWNHGRDGFELEDLPVESQISPAYAIAIEDFDYDGNLDIVLGGNFYSAKPEVGRYDASYGVFLKGNGKGAFISVSNKLSGLNIDDQVRSFGIIKGANNYLISARNNESLKIFRY